jgi:hypothetical protein
MGTASRLGASSAAVALLVLIAPLLGWAGRGEVLAPVMPFWDLVLVAAVVLIPGLVMRSFASGASAALLGVMVGYLISVVAFGTVAPEGGMVVGYLGSLGIPAPLSSLIVLVASSAVAGLLSSAMAPKVPEAVPEQGVAEVQPEEAVQETVEAQQPVQEEAKPPQPAVETAPTMAGEVQTQPEQVAAAQPAEVKPSPEVKVQVPEVGAEGEEEVLMVCLNCKREVPAKAAYCPYCGAKL